MAQTVAELDRGSLRVVGYFCPLHLTFFYLSLIMMEPVHFILCRARHLLCVFWTFNFWYIKFAVKYFPFIAKYCSMFFFTCVISQLLHYQSCNVSIRYYLPTQTFAIFFRQEDQNSVCIFCVTLFEQKTYPDTHTKVGKSNQWNQYFSRNENNVHHGHIPDIGNRRTKQRT